MASLNQRAWKIAEEAMRAADDLRLAVHMVGGATILDCGIQAVGGLQAGLLLARVCLSDLAEVSLVPGSIQGIPAPSIQVFSDDPVRACMASQYAGWQISAGKFFAMGSGPMRAAYGKEELFDRIGGKETALLAVGVLETRQIPNEEVIEFLSARLGLPAQQLMLLAAPTASIAGNVQVVARSLETALHKLYELEFDLSQVVSGYGVAPLPPVAAHDLVGIGRTNDAILYGGSVIITVRSDDDILAEVGPKVPSSASDDHGAPFGAIFERYDRDFYKIDPMLFSPAMITFHNLTTGRSHTFGRLEPEILQASFFGSS